MPYILTIILSFILAHPVWANTHFTVSDKTFFFHHRLDRIYFDPNGEFQQQLESQYGAIKSGELLKGQWQFNETRMELCMDYTVNYILNGIICVMVIGCCHKRA